MRSMTINCIKCRYTSFKNDKYHNYDRDFQLDGC